MNKKLFFSLIPALVFNLLVNSIFSMENIEKEFLLGQAQTKGNLPIAFNDEYLNKLSFHELNRLLEGLRPLLLQEPEIKRVYEKFGDVGIVAYDEMREKEKEKIPAILKKRNHKQRNFQILLHNWQDSSSINKYTAKITDYYYKVMATLLDNKIYRKFEETISENYIDLAAYFIALKEMCHEEGKKIVFDIEHTLQEVAEKNEKRKEDAIYQKVRELLKQEQKQFNNKLYAIEDYEYLTFTTAKLYGSYAAFLRNNPPVTEEKRVKKRILKNYYNVAYFFFIHDDQERANYYASCALVVANLWKNNAPALESNAQRFYALLKKTAQSECEIAKSIRWPFIKRKMPIAYKKAKKIKLSEIDKQ